MQHLFVFPSSQAHQPPRCAAACVCLVDVSLPRKVRKTFEDDTLPGGPYETTIEYVAPFFKPDREEDYRRAWAFFPSRGGELMSTFLRRNYVFLG